MVRERGMHVPGGGQRGRVLCSPRWDRGGDAFARAMLVAVRGGARAQLQLLDEYEMRLMSAAQDGDAAGGNNGSAGSGDDVESGTGSARQRSSVDTPQVCARQQGAAPTSVLQRCNRSALRVSE